MTTTEQPYFRAALSEFDRKLSSFAGASHFLWIERVSCLWSKLVANAMSAVKCCIESNRGATSTIGGFVSPLSDQRNRNAPLMHSTDWTECIDQEFVEIPCSFNRTGRLPSG